MKRWKITQLAGVLLLLLGVVARVGAGEYWGTGAMMLGTIMYAVGRVGAWLRTDAP